MGKNAYFQLNVKEDGIFLNVYPPEEGGEMIQIKEVLKYLDEHSLNTYDLKELNHAINDAEHATEVKVGDAGAITSVNESMSLDVALNKMELVVRFYPASNGGQNLQIKDIMDDITSAGIKYGVDQDMILSFTGNRQYCTDYIMAKGSNPVEGHDAEIKYYFNTDIDLKPKRNEDGTVNYRELNTISHVTEGDKIAELIKEDPGKPGFDIFGGEIKPHTVKTLKLEFGNNISTNEEKTVLISNVTGHANLINGKVFVSDVYEVAGDVDNSTGNIDYHGSVTIKGNVKGGFTVMAKGDIIVEGIVEDAILKSQGQIIVQRGIHGMNKGTLEAQGNIICKFIENARVISGGYIEAEAILHSKVDAFSEIHVSGKKGFITGGVIRAGKLVEAMTIGSEMETITKIEVGVDPNQKERHSQLQKQIADLNKEIEKIKPIVINYTSMIRRGEVLSKEKILYVKQLASKIHEYQDEIVPLQIEFQKISEIMALANSARVKVSKTIYAGVTITISDAALTLKDERNFSQFVREEGTIKAIPM